MNHSFMPIAIRVVSDEEFRAWTEYARQKFASGSGPKNKTTASREMVAAQ
jgi:cytochrome c oxidase subunit 2